MRVLARKFVPSRYSVGSPALGLLAVALTFLLAACGGGGGFARDDGGTFGTAINPPPGKVLVQGVVFDEVSGAPLSGVEISDAAPERLPETEIQRKSVPVGVTRTDVNGAFMLQAQPDQGRGIDLYFRAPDVSSAARFRLEDVPEEVLQIDVLVDINPAVRRATPREINVQLKDGASGIPAVRQRDHMSVVDRASGIERDKDDFGSGSVPVGNSVDDVDLIF